MASRHPALRSKISLRHAASSLAAVLLVGSTGAACKHDPLGSETSAAAASKPQAGAGRQCLTVPSSTAPAPGSAILASLRAGHPRLFITAEQLPELKALITKDPHAAAWYASLNASATAMIASPPIPQADKLATARRAFAQLSTLAGLYLLDGDTQKRDRAKSDLLTLAALPDWGTIVDFLSIAEMTAAVATGYDWLYADLTPEERATVKNAIVQNGLRAALKNPGAMAAKHNWGQVCNGGIGLGAMSIADEEQELAASTLNGASRHIAQSMDGYSPSGAWYEGPIYWRYASEYATFFMAGAETALGTDFGLTRTLGLADTGRYFRHLRGPLGQTFNFSDARPAMDANPVQLFWLARAFDRPNDMRLEAALADSGLRDEWPDVFHLFWYDPTCAAVPAAAEPLDALFQGINSVAFVRTAWDDPKAFYVGFKAGQNDANHSHLDIGSFVFDALGQRWAADIGPDNYALPGYFGSQRFSYYRLRTEGQNTLTISQKPQSPLAFASQRLDAHADFVAYKASPGFWRAVVDMLPAYAGTVDAAQRGIALIDGRQLLVQDEISAAKPVEVIWNFHTQAAVSVAGATATLTQGGVSMRAEILSPPGAFFAAVAADPGTVDPGTKENRNPGITNLTARVPGLTTNLRLVVRLYPAGETPPIPAIKPLTAWGDED